MWIQNRKRKIKSLILDDLEIYFDEDSSIDDDSSDEKDDIDHIPFDGDDDDYVDNDCPPFVDDAHDPLDGSLLEFR